MLYNSFMHDSRYIIMYIYLEISSFFQWKRVRLSKECSLISYLYSIIYLNSLENPIGSGALSPPPSPTSLPPFTVLSTKTVWIQVKILLYRDDDHDDQKLFAYHNDPNQINVLSLL